MNVEIELPDLGDEAGDHATVAEWYFEEGDVIQEGDELLQVIAENFTIDIPATVSGVLIEQLMDVEELVRVGDPVAIVEVPEELEEMLEE